MQFHTVMRNVIRFWLLEPLTHVGNQIIMQNITVGIYGQGIFYITQQYLERKASPVNVNKMKA